MNDRSELHGRSESSTRAESSVRAGGGGLRGLLADTWPWVLAPFVLLYGSIALYLLVFRDSPTPFVYTIY